MKALLLAAGLGTRLRPLTLMKPKSLVPVLNRPVIARNIDYLRNYDIEEIIVNAHYHSRQILDYLGKGDFPGVSIEVRVETEILGTGGGIKNCSDFWDDSPFIVMNSDILTDIDLKKVLEYHNASQCVATLVLHDYEPFNQIRIDDKSQIVDISQGKKPGRLAFTGIHILEPGTLSYIPESGYSSIIDCYKRMIRSHTAINAYLSKGHYWHDIGSPDRYMKANREMLKLHEMVSEIGRDSIIAPSAEFIDWAIVGEKAHVEDGVEIERSILWDHVKVRENVRIIDSIVTSYRDVEKDLIREIY